MAHRLALILLLLIGLPSPAAAAARFWFVWDRTASLEPGPMNYNFTGPTTVRAAIVARGLSGEIIGHEVFIWLHSREATFPDALRFDPAGCQAGRAHVRPAPTDPLHHGLVTPAHLTMEDVAQYDASSSMPWLRLYTAASSGPNPGYIAHPESTYVLAEIDFDLQSVTAGPTSGSTCGCASQSLSLRRPSVSVYHRGIAPNPTFDEEVVVTYYDCVGWNDPNSAYCYLPDCFNGDPRCWPRPLPSTCDAAVAGTTMSWGRVKASYR